MDDILLVADPQKKYGEQWYFTFTNDAFQREMERIKVGEEEARNRLEAEAEVRLRLLPRRFVPHHHVSYPVDGIRFCLLQSSCAMNLSQGTY